MSITLIGERINGSFKDVGRAIQQRDKTVIQDRIARQTAGGADYLDVNMGAASRNPDDFAWLVQAVAGSTALPLSIDCNRLDMFRIGLKAYRDTVGDRPVIINSTTAEDSKLIPLLELASEYKAGIIGVVMDEKGSPQDVDRRLELGGKIFAAALEAGIPTEQIYLDPIVMPAKFMQDQARNVLNAIQQMTTLSDPPPHISVGLSNISSKAEERKLINRTFMVMAMAVGLDAAILDVCDEEMRQAIATAELMLGMEIYSDAYLKAYRQRAGSGSAGRP
jgi:5-methyltetrahydrofolate corrinoid/iron sulfur protein methyltransferase